MNFKTTWIIGLPGNKIEQLECIDLIKEILPNQISFHIFCPFPNTIYWSESKKYGINIPENVNWSKINYSFEKILDEISFDYLSRSEISEIMQEIKAELGKIGYKLPSDYIRGSEEKTLKVFTDHMVNFLIKDREFTF